MATEEDKKDDLTTCSICFETFKTPKYFPCLHSFCEGCIQTYITKTFDQAQGGVNCPLCRMFVSKPDGIKVEDWSTKLPTNHILVSLIDLNDIKSGQKLCAACSRENETESAFSWCVSCCEALCKFCDRSHRKNKASSNHKLVELDEKTSKDIPLNHAEIHCTEHPEKIVEAYCNDHSIICCMTCVMLNHRKCDNVGSIEDAAEATKKSKEIEEFSNSLQILKTSLEKLIKDKTKHIQIFDTDIKKTRTDVETLFSQIVEYLNKLKTSFMSEISKVEKEIKPRAENACDELKYRIPIIDNDLALFQTNMKHAPPAHFMQAIGKLGQQKELLENFVKDQSKNLQVIRVTFSANEKLLEISKVIHEFGKMEVSGLVCDGVQRMVEPKINMLKAVPFLSSEVATDFEVGGIALLDNGLVVLSDYENCRIELRDVQSSYVLSSLTVKGKPCGIKMTSDTEGAVAVEGYGVVIFKMLNKQIVKVTAFKAELKSDFVYHQRIYYLGCKQQITVYNSQGRNVNSISVKHSVGFMALCDNKSLCYTTFDEDSSADHLYCVRMDGTHVFTYSHNALRTAYGVTVDHSGNIYVCGHYFHNIHQLSHDGKLQRIIFEYLPACPFCVSFNTLGDKAVIGCTDKILLYDLK